MTSLLDPPTPQDLAPRPPALARSPFCVHECVELALDLAAEEAAQARVELVYLPASTLDEVLLGDVGRLQQVLVFLIHQAIQGAPAASIVELRAHSERTGERSFDLVFSLASVDSGHAAPPRGRPRDAGIDGTVFRLLLEAMGGQLVARRERERCLLSLALPFPLLVERPPLLSPVEPLAGLEALAIGAREPLRAQLDSWCAAWGLALRHGAPEGLPRDLGDALLLLPEELGPEGGRFLEGGLPALWLGAGAPGGCAAVERPLRPRRFLHQLLRLVGEEPTVYTGLRDRDPAEGALRVLVAEDQPIHQRILRAMLQRLGHAVELVPDGRLAVEAARERPYDVILMDMQMPRMNGQEATRIIRGMQRHPRPLILGISSNDSAEFRALGLLAGMDAYLPKPTTAEQLAAVLRRAAVRPEGVRCERGAEAE